MLKSVIRIKVGPKPWEPENLTKDIEKYLTEIFLVDISSNLKYKKIARLEMRTFKVYFCVSVFTKVEVIAVNDSILKEFKMTLSLLRAFYDHDILRFV